MIMKRRVLTLSLVFRLLCPLVLNWSLACAAAEVLPPSYDRSLLVLRGAKNLKFGDHQGLQSISYTLVEEYPATRSLEAIKEELKKSGWRPLQNDYLNPHISSSHITGWNDFLDATETPKVKVHQWLAQWQDAKGNVVWYQLQYRYPAGGAPDLSTLDLSATYAPASVARQMQTQTFETQKD